MADVLMYYHDVLLCYGISVEDPKELRVLLEGMIWFRDQVTQAGGLTEDIDAILLRIMKSLNTKTYIPQGT